MNTTFLNFCLSLVFPFHVPYIIIASYHEQKRALEVSEFQRVLLRVNMKADLVNAKYLKTFQSHFLLLIAWL